MDFIAAALPDVILVKPRVFADDRGLFKETWHAGRFAAAGIPGPFVQDNHSRSRRHVLRGLHFQIEHPQGKLVGVVRGAVFDVVVDFRRGSAHFGQWWGTELNDQNQHLLWVPPGFAHGFLTLSDEADVVYKCTEYYAPQSERSLRWNDPDVAIAWPLPAGVAPLLYAKDATAPQQRDAGVAPLLSAKDATAPLLRDAETIG
jgi:dTDP-4-dehydrorhamnose 3,5-epimerase